MTIREQNIRGKETGYNEGGCGGGSGGVLWKLRAEKIEGNVN